MAYIPLLLSNKYHSFVALCRSLCSCMCKHLLLRLSHDLHDSLGGESLLSIEIWKGQKIHQQACWWSNLTYFLFIAKIPSHSIKLLLEARGRKDTWWSLHQSLIHEYLKEKKVNLNCHFESGDPICVWYKNKLTNFSELKAEISWKK